MNRITNLFAIGAFTFALVAGVAFSMSPASTLAFGTTGSGGCCSSSGSSSSGSSNSGGGSYTPPSYTPPKVKNPTCSLSASDTSITRGESVVLSWSSSNASSAYLSNVGTINVGGSTTVSPNYTTTYTATFTGQNNKQVTCSKTITVNEPPVVVEPSCSLVASPATITRGDSAAINWSSSNASSGFINQGIGNVSLSGSRTVAPQNTTTYTATFTRNGQSVNCSTTIYVNEPPVVINNAPTCNIYVNNYNQYNYNQPVTLTWASANASYGWINQGLGTIAINGSRTVYPTQSTTYTATFVGYNGQQVNCSVTVNVNGYVPPPIYPNPTPYVTLSAVPYTGLDLGPVGTALYWGFLVAWCVLAAYLIAVKRVHLELYRWYSAMLFGTVSHSAKVAHARIVASAPAAPAAAKTDAVDAFILSQVNRAK